MKQNKAVVIAPKCLNHHSIEK